MAAAVAFITLPFVGSILPSLTRSLARPAGIDNDGIHTSPVTFRGLPGIALAVSFTMFYVVIYFGDRLTIAGTSVQHVLQKSLYSLLDPISLIMRGAPSDQWFFYGTVYTAAILAFGLRMIIKYRHSRYQIIRTVSVMGFQLFFAYLIPSLLSLFKQPAFYFSYFWPLKPEYLYPYKWAELAGRGIQTPGFWFLAFALIMTFVATPVLTYFLGKRWYCSWVCGCGGLAETMGDPFRHLSNKSLPVWKFERWIVHGILAAIIVITILLWINSATSGTIFGQASALLAEWYGFYIGAIFSGVVGVGFYPILGSRVWCRFGCPMAAYLGIIQKYFSRFRITTNGGQCISCGNCSTYCEMGIDVKWYAQRGQDIVRSSCVGCGICSAVCPRGVLKLETGPVSSRRVWEIGV
ncbi:MAG: 4Fe-4S binding protein [Leptospirales bacterium]|nr:4Fe-4S binding protein [Leptospirales bacterium]